MCQCFAGSVLLSFHRDDPFTLAALEATFASDRVRFLQESVPQHALMSVFGLPHRFVQIAVAPGEESLEADGLRLGIVSQLQTQGDFDRFRRIAADPKLSPLIQQEEGRQ